MTVHPIAVTLENRLMSSGYYVKSFERDGDTVVLEYEAISPVSTVTNDEVGDVVRTILEIAAERESWTPPTFDVTSVTTDGQHRGTWHVKAEWFEQLDDELSQVEFSQYVLETITVPTDDR